MTTPSEPKSLEAHGVLGNRTWQQVPTEELNATVHSYDVASLPWARRAAQEWESRTREPSRKAWCICPWCKSQS